MIDTERRQGLPEQDYGHRAGDLPDPLQGIEDLGASIDEVLQDTTEVEIAILLSPELDDLESLFAEAVGIAKETAEAKKSRERIKQGGLSAAERAADAERIRLWELKHEWVATANVAAFEEHVCLACDTAHRIFTSLMIRQRHRNLNNGAMRWQTVAVATPGLPNEVAIRRIEHGMCEDCADTNGWDLSIWTEWK